MSNNKVNPMYAGGYLANEEYIALAEQGEISDQDIGKCCELVKKDVRIFIDKSTLGLKGTYQIVSSLSKDNTILRAKEYT